MNQIYIYIITFFFYSFLGWSMEVINVYRRQNKWVNRGFLLGPICPIYGYGCLSIIILLQKYSDDPITLTIMSIVICGLLEYFTSYFMEKIFKLRWWDYSDKKYNIAGRVCLENLIVFGILGASIMYLLNPLIVNILNKLPDITIEIIAIILFIIYIIDNILTFNVISKVKTTALNIRKDSTEEITRIIRETLRKQSYLTRRIVESFDFKPSKELIEEIKQKMKETKDKAKEINEFAKQNINKAKNKTKETINKTKQEINKIRNK